MWYYHSLDFILLFSREYKARLPIETHQLKLCQISNRLSLDNLVMENLNDQGTKSNKHIKPGSVGHSSSCFYTIVIIETSKHLVRQIRLVFEQNIKW